MMRAADSRPDAGGSVAVFVEEFATMLAAIRAHRAPPDCMRDWPAFDLRPNLPFFCAEVNAFRRAALFAGRLRPRRRLGRCGFRRRLCGFRFRFGHGASLVVGDGQTIVAVRGEQKPAEKTNLTPPAL